jgi:hypothetical protein
MSKTEISNGKRDTSSGDLKLAERDLHVSPGFFCLYIKIIIERSIEE